MGRKPRAQKEKGHIFYHFNKTTTERGLDREARKAVLPISPS